MVRPRVLGEVRTSAGVTLVGAGDDGTPSWLPDFGEGVGGNTGTDEGTEGNIAGVLMKGENFLRNFLFLNVTLPDPSTLILYWSCCITSTTTPVFSQRRGWFPVWL